MLLSTRTKRVTIQVTTLGKVLIKSLALESASFPHQDTERHFIYEISECQRASGKRTSL